MMSNTYFFPLLSMVQHKIIYTGNESEKALVSHKITELTGLNSVAKYNVQLMLIQCATYLTDIHRTQYNLQPKKTSIRESFITL